MLVCGWRDLVQRYLNEIETKKSFGMDWVWSAIELISLWLYQPESKVEEKKHTSLSCFTKYNRYELSHSHYAVGIKAQGSDTGGAFLLSSICLAVLSKHWEQTNLQQIKHLLWSNSFHTYIYFIISFALALPSAKCSTLHINKTSYRRKAVRFYCASSHVMPTELYPALQFQWV